MISSSVHTEHKHLPKEQNEGADFNQLRPLYSIRVIQERVPVKIIIVSSLYLFVILRNDLLSLGFLIWKNEAEWLLGLFLHDQDTWELTHQWELSQHADKWGYSVVDDGTHT